MSMSPMDEEGWFQPLKLSYTSTQANARQMLCGHDAHRVGLIISNGSNTTPIFIAPDAQLPGSGSKGIQLSTAEPFIQLDQKTYGPLVQSEWWVTSTSAGIVVTVIEILLRDWPSGV